MRLKGVLAGGLAATAIASAAGCGNLQSAPVVSGSTTVATTPLVANPHRFGGPGNFIATPSFEGRVEPWAPWGPNSAVELTKGQHRFGRFAAAVISTHPAQYGIQYAGVVALPARGLHLVVTAYLKSADRPKGVYVMLQGVAASGAPVIVAGRTVQIGSTWRRIAIAGTVHSSRLEALNLYILVLHSIGAGEGFYLDGVSVGENGAPH